MNEKINSIKAEIFDILVRQDQLRVQIQHWEQQKQEKLKELQDLLQSNDSENQPNEESDSEDQQID